MIRDVIYLGNVGLLKVTYLIIKIQQLRFHIKELEKMSFFNTFQTILNEFTPYCETLTEILHLDLVSFNLGFKKSKVGNLVE